MEELNIRIQQNEQKQKEKAKEYEEERRKMSEKQKNSNDIRKRCNSFRFFGILSMFVKKNSQHKIMTYTVHGSYERKW